MFFLRTQKTCRRGPMPRGEFWTPLQLLCRRRRGARPAISAPQCSIHRACSLGTAIGAEYSKYSTRLVSRGSRGDKGETRGEPRPEVPHRQVPTGPDGITDTDHAESFSARCVSLHRYHVPWMTSSLGPRWRRACGVSWSSTRRRTTCILYEHTPARTRCVGEFCLRGSRPSLQPPDRPTDRPTSLLWIHVRAARCINTLCLVLRILRILLPPHSKV